MSKEIATVYKEISEKLDSNVIKVIGSKALQGFEKAFIVASATAELKKLLTTEYMKPIMDLQGSKLGFKTDRDDKGGYSMDVVRNCLIEAVLTGVQPVNNQFNIIAGNCYITKEGFGYLLKNTSGLSYEVIPALPRINADKTSAAVSMKISWSFNKGAQELRDIELPIKMNAYMGADAVIGKANRKARAWLFNTINDCEIADGDISDIEHKVVETKINKAQDRVTDMINSATSVEDLQTRVGKAELTSEQQELFDYKKEELLSKAVK
jgi:hypothetical protein